MDISPFQFEDYREFVRARCEQATEKGLVTRMAKACECERSHISRMLHGHIHLTMDQAYRMAEFWSLSEEEAIYFLRLVEHARAGSERYRRKLQQEIVRLRQAHENLSKRLKQPAPEFKTGEVSYYTAWYWSAIHILVSIPEFQTVPHIAERLQLPHELVQHTLLGLKDLRLVAQEKDCWVFSSTTIHLPKESPLLPLHFANWRNKAVQNSQVPRAEGLHYTTVQSLSADDFQRLKEIFLRMIDQFQTIAGPSREEELVCFNLDFYRV